MIAQDFLSRCISTCLIKALSLLDFSIDFSQRLALSGQAAKGDLRVKRHKTRTKIRKKENALIPSCLLLYSKVVLKDQLLLLTASYEADLLN